MLRIPKLRYRLVLEEGVSPPRVKNGTAETGRFLLLPLEDVRKLGGG